MTIRFPGKAQIDPGDPQAVGVCDRCGKLFNLTKLRRQPVYAGREMIFRNILICHPCEDAPNPQTAALRVPADPDPLFGTRVENFDLDEKNYLFLTKIIQWPFMFYPAQSVMTCELANLGKLLFPTFEGLSGLTAELAAAFGLAADFDGLSAVDADLKRGIFMAADFDGLSAVDAETALGLGMVASLGGVGAVNALLSRGIFIDNILIDGASNVEADLTQTVYTPASMVFNGTNEALTRTLSTSGASTTIATYSLWLKPDAYPDDTAALFQVINAPTDTQYIIGGIDETSGDTVTYLSQDSGSDAFDKVVENATAVPTGNWTHLVFRYDSTQGTAADRIRIYKNGALETTVVFADNPGASEAQRLFTNGRQHQIGAWLDASQFFDGKLAFIDVLAGVSADPTAFAFNDGGTWTRQPYAGSYGTYGFSIDGSNGFNDVSGNGQNFTGMNMDGSNLDTGDLPPYVP